MSAPDHKPTEVHSTAGLLPASSSIRPSCRHALRNALLLALLPLGMPWAQAQVAVSDGGSPVYSQAIGVPAGVAGMSPKLGLSYAGGGVNGPVGHGWSVQGISVITRCPAIRAIDGIVGSVAYNASDKLCLDGQRLIQTDAAATVLPFPQTNDAQGLGSGYREYRTEKDTYVRVRAYGYANGDTTGASGPAYFKVWTKSGQIYDYGASPVADSNTKALVNAQGKNVAVAWAVARISDTLGNFIDFKYEQRDVAWGSGPIAGSPTLGHEWNLAEVQYSGNKVIFNYTDRTATTPRDASEAYHLGSKNVSVRRLQSITTYINSPNTSTLGAAANAVAVKTTKLVYDNGPVTGRSRVTSIQECAGNASSTRCLPANSFTYASGGNDAYQANANFNLGTLVMQDTAGKYGVLPADFNGDGKTDLIRWSDNPAENQLYLSNGDGSFTQVPNGTGAGKFNITDQNLFKSDNCYTTLIQDINGDGLPDLLRYSAPTNADGASCSAYGPIYVYLNNGDGSFSRQSFVGPVLERTISKPLDDCLVTRTSSGYCAEPADHKGWTRGANFFFLDVNGDGRLDIVTTILPRYGINQGGGDPCASTICTRVYTGNGDGTFSEISTDLAHSSVYVEPKAGTGIGAPKNVVDVNGDGLADLLGIQLTTFNSSSVFLSRGNGNFIAGGQNVSCQNPLDFNGDGRADCLSPGAPASNNKLQLANGTEVMPNVANFDLTLNIAGQELGGAGTGIVIADINGDGRHDIIRWKDDPTQNVVYLSNGDGTFTQSYSFNLNTAATQLKKSDGTSDFVTGDFTGRGNTEILRLKSSPTAGAATANQLYVKVDSTPPDQLLTATSASGARTTLYYVPLSNATPSNGVSGSYGPRYTSDRGTGNAATGSKRDLTFPMYVVATSATESGLGREGVSTINGGTVGGATVLTEYSYLGLKVDTNGRGPLGFREVRRQTPAPNGDPLSIFTKYLQDHPYIGVASRTETRYGTVNNTGAQLLSSTSNVYCDQTASGAEASATETAPCPVSAKVQRPYLRQSVESGTDPSGAALPQVTTTHTFNGSGDPTSIVATTTGSVAGIAQTFTKTTSNTYQADDTACSTDTNCNWIRGRLTRASVQSSVPNSLASLATSAGTSANATATKGSVKTSFPLPPAVLATILQLLLQD